MARVSAGASKAFSARRGVVNKQNEPSWDVRNAPMHGTDILEICGSLITYNEKERIVTLSHYSVKVCSRSLNGLLGNMRPN